MASQPDRHPDVSYLQLDACSLDKQLESCSFDVVVDKGCTDALDCGGKTELALAQMHRVLKPGGLLMLVSCRDPEQRLKPDSLLTQRFHLLETVPLPEGPGSPCACAYLYCLRSSTGAEQ